MNYEFELASQKLSAQCFIDLKRPQEINCSLGRKRSINRVEKQAFSWV